MPEAYEILPKCACILDRGCLHRPKCRIYLPGSQRYHWRWHQKLVPGMKSFHMFAARSVTDRQSGNIASWRNLGFKKCTECINLASWIHPRCFNEASFILLHRPPARYDEQGDSLQVWQCIPKVGAI